MSKARLRHPPYYDGEEVRMTSFVHGVLQSYFDVEKIQGADHRPLRSDRVHAESQRRSIVGSFRVALAYGLGEDLIALCRSGEETDALMTVAT
jgi:hypothetical protein